MSFYTVVDFFNIIKKNKLGLNLKLSKAIRKVVEIDIEFFDMPKGIAQEMN